MSTKREGIKCYENAADDEPLFVLRAQDVLAPEIVREWAFRAAAAGVPAQKVEQARRDADAMEDYQTTHRKKVPD